MNATSKDIKFALMCYYRWTRNMLCATECMCEDVIAIKGGMVWECEVKISKSDMWNGEKKKSKHTGHYKHGSENACLYIPNYYYMCVPERLVDEAIKWTEAINNKYGVIKYINIYNVSVVKKAKKLHNERVKEWTIKALMMRVCGEYISFLKQEYEGNHEKDS